MLASLLKRLGQTVLVLFGISVLVFAVFFATPGADPTARIAGRNASPQTLAAVRHQYGFDRPLPVQYLRMMDKLFVSRDLPSFVDHGELVVPEVIHAAPVTLSLVGGAAVVWVVVSVMMGTLAAATRDSLLDRGLMMLGLVGTWITLAVLFIGIYGRVLRADLVAASGEDFMRTARAKGLSESRVLLRHGLRTSLITFVSLFGLDFAQLVGGGALLTEVVFGLQGVGRLTYQGLINLDLPLIMATVMYSAVFVVLANAVVDLVYLLLDPRVRDGR